MLPGRLAQSNILAKAVELTSAALADAVFKRGRMADNRPSGSVAFVLKVNSSQVEASTSTALRHSPLYQTQLLAPAN